MLLPRVKPEQLDLRSGDLDARIFDSSSISKTLWICKWTETGLKSAKIDDIRRGLSEGTRGRLAIGKDTDSETFHVIVERR